MTPTPNRRNPHPENGSPITDLSLEAQIVRAERAVIARDARIRRRADHVVGRIRHGALRQAGAGALVTIASVGLTWWLGRRNATAPPPPPPRPAATEGEHLAREAGLSLASLVPLVWPYMPKALRKTVTPGMASTVLAFVAPLFGRLFRRAPKEVA